MIFDKYEKMGDYHWRWFKENHPTYSKHAKFVAKWVKERPCLDVGCGDGLITSLLGDGAIGMDESMVATVLARRHGVDVFTGSVYNMEALTMFEAVLLADVIEHLEKPRKAISKIAGILKRNGFLYVSTPPASDDGKLHDPYHIVEYKPKDLVRLVEGEGFKLDGEVIVRNDLVEMYAKFRRL